MELVVCYGGLDNPQATADVLLKNEAYIIETGPDFFLNSDDDKIKNTAKVFREKGISIRSIHAPFGSDANLSDIDAKKRDGVVQTHRDLLYKAALADVEMIIIHPGAGAVSPPEDMEKLNLLAFESISRLVDAAEATGVKLALENMLPGHLGCKIEHIIDILEKVNSKSLGVCFDSGHAHACGNMKEFMEAVGEQMISIHMQDNDGSKDMHLQPPYGTTDWSAFVEVLNKVNYRRPITIEAAPWGRASYRQMLKEVSAVIETSGDSSCPPKEWQGDSSNITFRCGKCGHAILKSEGQWFCNCNTDS